MKWEAAAKLAAGPVGLTWKLTRRRKTARATRHPSLSGEERTPNAESIREQASQRRSANAQCRKNGGLEYWSIENAGQAFLIALTMASNSGQSPVSSLEWRSLPLARISKAPPLEGMSVSDLMRSPSSRILAAKLTAFGV